MEEWRAVVGYEGFYDVSSIGRVKSVRRVILRSDGLAQTIHEKILVLRVVDGYAQICLCRAGVEKYRYVHVLMLEAFVGPKPNGYETAHGDGIRLNNVLPNLRWATPEDNQNDKSKHGTQTRGTEVIFNKLTEEQVIDIKSRLAHGKRGIGARLAEQYGVTPSCISFIRSGRSWAWL